MKYATYPLAVLALATQAAAFPAGMWEALAEQSKPNAPLERRLNGINPGFDAAAQYVSNKGAHKFVAPGPTDLRGPCPGLNAMANHNYLPHNGYATIAQFVAGTNAVFGMGLDLATFLSVYGAVFDGDLLGWSIGGPAPSSLLNPLAGLIGQPEGISGSHNKYEGDASPVKGDLYQYGNDYLNVPKQFNQLYALQAHETEATSNYDIGLLTSFRATRFAQSIANNPYFFNGPFSGLMVQPAAYTFIYRFMANKSAEYPEGRLSKAVLKDFFSMTGTYPKFKYTPGYERLPSNWYKRAIGDEYTIPFFETDVVAAALTYPQFLSVGGNTGTVNTFTGVDITNLTGGIYNTKTLTTGNNLMCIVFQLVIQAAPDILEGLFTSTTGATTLLGSAIANATDGLGCKSLNTIQQSQFDAAYAKYPGYTKLSSTGTY